MSTWKLCDHPNHEYSIPHRDWVCNVKRLRNTKTAPGGVAFARQKLISLKGDANTNHWKSYDRIHWI